MIFILPEWKKEMRWRRRKQRGKVNTRRREEKEGGGKEAGEVEGLVIDLGFACRNLPLPVGFPRVAGDKWPALLKPACVWLLLL